MTTAPNAPRANSSHRNQNRSCPGVPNRYSTTSSEMVIRPKSIATVVVVLSSTPARSSVPMLASVSISSVCSGMISLQDATNVVFPTPKPPATRILRAVGILDGFAWSERPEAIYHRLEDVLVGWVDRRIGVEGGHQASLKQVAYEYPDHADRQIQPCG